MTFFSDAATFARVRAALCPFTSLSDLDEYAHAIVRVVQEARRRQGEAPRALQHKAAAGRQA